MTVIVREYNPDEVLPSSESNTENCTTCMSSQDYLEAMDSLKEKYDDFKAKEKKLQEKIEHMKKDFSSLYGLTRVLDMLTTFDAEVPREISDFIDISRSFASECFDRHILNKG